MRTSEKSSNVLQKLFNVSSELEPLVKDKDNPFYKSKYADHLQIWQTIKDPCKESGLLVTHGTNIDPTGKFLSVITRVTDVESNEWVETDFFLPLEKFTPQGSGSAFTYGCRYGTEGIFNMAREGADDDGNAAEPKKKASASKEKGEGAKSSEKAPAPSTGKTSGGAGKDEYVSDRQGCISIVGKSGKGKGQLGLLYVMMGKHGVEREAAKAFIAENYEWPENSPMQHFEDLTTAEMNEVLEWMQDQGK